MVQAPILLVRLISHPNMPLEAWPPLVRRSLPGSGATVAWLVVLAVLGGVTILWLAWHRSDGRRTRGAPGPRPGPGGNVVAIGRSTPVPHLGVSGPRRRRRGRCPRHGGGRTPRDLRPLRVTKAPGDRIVLGTHAGHLLAAEPRHSVMVVGPTQSGKTSGLAIPAILEWSGPILATSVKADLLHATLEWRKSLGEVQYYDPTGSVGLVAEGSRASGWSPLARAMTWPGARRIASALCSVARAGDGGMEDAGFWYANAEKLLAPLLFAAATAGATMADVVRWLDEEETTEVLLALELAGVPEALRAARASLGREERQRASVYATAETVVAAFADPAVAASAENCEIDPAALVGGSAGSLFCCAPAREQERLAPVFTAIVREVLDAAFERAACDGPAARSAALGRARRGGKRCSSRRLGPRRGDGCRPWGPAGHGLAGPRAGRVALRQPLGDGREQSPRQARVLGDRRSRYLAAREWVARRRRESRAFLDRWRRWPAQPHRGRHGACARASGLAPSAASRRGRPRLRELPTHANRPATILRRPRAGESGREQLSSVTRCHVRPRARRPQAPVPPSGLDRP